MMHTARSFTVRATKATRCQYLEWVWSKGYAPGGGYGPWGVWFWGNGPSLDRLTHACENITFLQLGWLVPVPLHGILDLSPRGVNLGPFRDICVVSLLSPCSI